MRLLPLPSSRLRTLLASHLGCPPERVTADALLVDDLGADSLDAVELAMAIEEEFGVEVPDDEPMFRSAGTRVRDLVTWVEQRSVG